jgi:hypothetical protein
VKKIKKNYKTGGWWSDQPGVEYYMDYGYFRSFHYKQRVARNIIDTLDFRDMLIIKKAWRCDDRPLTPYDDIMQSRGYYVKSWKDNSRRKNQWYRENS